MFKFDFLPGKEEIAQPAIANPGLLDDEVCANPIQHLISTLPPVLSYSFVNISTSDDSQILVPRRELWDCRMQLMKSDDSSANADLIRMLGNTDLIKGAYEGGLKTWECSIDLARYVHTQSSLDLRAGMEFGCGSAVPSCALLSKVFKNPTLGSLYILQDYNLRVLELVTLPNVYLTWLLTIGLLPLSNEGVVEVTDAHKLQFLEYLDQQQISLYFVHGPWGDTMIVRLLNNPPIPYSNILFFL